MAFPTVDKMNLCRWLMMGCHGPQKNILTIMDGAMETTRVHGNCKIEVAWALPLNEIRAAMDMFEEKFAWAKNSRFSDRGREISVRFCRAR